MPWLGLQLLAASTVILRHGLVTMRIDKPLAIDLDKVKIEVPIEQYAPPPELAPPEIPAK